MYISHLLQALQKEILLGYNNYNNGWVYWNVIVHFEGDSPNSSIMINEIPLLKNLLS